MDSYYSRTQGASWRRFVTTIDHILQAMSKYDYSQIDPGYYDNVFNKKRGIQSRWHHHKFETLGRLLPKNGEHLDVGCGPGTFIGTLAKSHNIKSLGIDFSRQQVDYARINHQSVKARFECIDLFEANSKSLLTEKFDIITFVEVIEHIENNEAVRMLAKARSMLKPGGKIIITTPNYHSGWGALEKLVNAIGEVSYEDQHINRYSYKKLSHDLQRAGFTQINISSFLSFSPFIAALSWRASKFMSIQELYCGPLRPLGFLLIAEAYC